MTESTEELIQEAYQIVNAEKATARQNELASMMLGAREGYTMHKLLTECGIGKAIATGAQA